MVKYLSLVGLAFLGAGCSLLKASPHRFAVEKKWVRGTLEREYLSGRRMHRFPPLLTENLVITGNAIDGIVAYDRASAYPIWRLAVKDGVEAGAELANGILYFGAGDGQFYAVQPENGQVLWTYPLKAEGIARPLVRGGVVYVLGGNNVAHALNAQTGKLIWVYNRREAGNISVRGGSRPAVAGDFVMFGFSDGSLVALNRTSGAVVWESSLNRNKRFRDVDAS
ncbi:MAG: PQQ-binding-like beta-propeller repeat protein, partial [Bdellovibrionales bacterium]